MMNQSSMVPEYPHGFEFDYQADFTQFLEEARNSAGQGAPNPNTGYLQADRKKQMNGDIKNKKSWKKALFSWLKKDKKKEPANGIRVAKQSRGLFSGPVQRSERPISSVRSQRPLSGPLTSICGSRPSSEDYDCEVPYASLRQLSDPRKLRYGPVYLVT